MGIGVSLIGGAEMPLECFGVICQGQLGAVTSRGEAQVIRLALLYALLDSSDHIRSEHLKAALAFWKYAEESARLIFGGLTAEQRRILNFLANGPKTKTEISRACFQGHRKAAAIQDDLDAIISKYIQSKKDQKGVERFLLRE